jgi:hypothetical protein
MYHNCSGISLESALVMMHCTCLRQATDMRKLNTLLYATPVDRFVLLYY